MVINLFEKTLGSPPILPEPLVKANQSLAVNLEKIVIFQINALKAYFAIGLNQMKAAAEITDMESLKGFYKRQFEITQTLQQKMLNDTKAVAERTVRFKTELDHLVQSTFEDILSKGRLT